MRDYGTCFYFEFSTHSILVPVYPSGYRHIEDANLPRQTQSFALSRDVGYTDPFRMFIGYSALPT
jgi:hypothetical protein